MLPITMVGNNDGKIFFMNISDDEFTLLIIIFELNNIRSSNIINI